MRAHRSPGGSARSGRPLANPPHQECASVRPALSPVLRPARIAATTVAAVTLSLATTGGIATAANHQPAAEQQVSYLGLTFSVPADWPVVTLGPTTCVRFDQHAVYLGTPG